MYMRDHFKTIGSFFALFAAVFILAQTAQAEEQVSEPVEAQTEGAAPEPAVAQAEEKPAPEPVKAQTGDSTPEQAKAHAEKAAEYVRKHGPDAAAVEFNKKDSEFVQGDLYVFVVDTEGVFLAHPIKPVLVGKNMMALKDPEGTPLVKNFTEIEGEGWSPYKWPHPVTKKILPKKSYIINVDGFILGVGAYYEE